MNERRTAKKVAAEKPDFVEVDGVHWPVMSSESMAALCGFTPTFLRELVSCLSNIDYYWFEIDLHGGGPDGAADQAA